MKKKPKALVTRTAGELAEALGLERADGIELAVRSALSSIRVGGTGRENQANSA